VDVPARIEEAVVRSLRSELGARGLLLNRDRVAAAEAEAAREGARLLPLALGRCYGTGTAAVEFESERVAARLAAALAFGAVTARVLAEPELEPERELICALFNMGIGLVDGLCDGDPTAGASLLELVQAHDLGAAAATPRLRGWLRASLPPALAADATAAFAADVIEAFFETLHLAYPADGWLVLRRSVGVRLRAALEAEQQTVAGSAAADRGRLLESSRLTSVLPFEIIATLAGGAAIGAATQLGEAMWLIDDLVDLADDCGTGALNGLVLRAPGGADLERLLHSTAVPDAAAEAAEKLESGLLGRAGTDAFLYFVQSYAGL
jgi:hypothetical protein